MPPVFTDSTLPDEKDINGMRFFHPGALRKRIVFIKIAQKEVQILTICPCTYPENHDGSCQVSSENDLWRPFDVPKK